MIYLDLSQPIYEGIPVYPGDPLFESRPFAEHDTDGFHGARYAIGSHLGTHLDAPFHFFVDGETLDSFPLEFFHGPAACLNLAPRVGPTSPRYRAREDRARPATMTVEDLEPFEPLLETTPIVLLRADWSDRVGSPEYYDDFPSLSPELCDWLADFPTLRILGLETPSLVASPQPPNPSAETEKERVAKFDPELAVFLPEIAEPNPLVEPPTTIAADESRPFDELELHADAECHRILLGRRPPILLLEGLTRLAKLPQYERPEDGTRVLPDDSRQFELSCYPLAIRGADGSPTRVVARVA